RQRLNRRAAAVDVERRLAVDERDVRAGRALERPSIVAAAARPGDGGTVGIGRIGRGKEIDVALARGAAVTHGAQPVDRTRECELGGAESLDEIAAPDPARFLECAEGRLDRAEAAFEALGRDSLTGDDSVPVEQRERDGV